MSWEMTKGKAVLEGRRFVHRLKKRLLPFLDMSFWVLTIISLVPLWFLDRAMILTLLQWCAFGLALAGVAVVLCRILLPQIDLTAYVREAEKGSVAAALVILGVTLMLSVIFLAMVLWAKT